MQEIEVSGSLDGIVENLTSARRVIEEQK